jgi:phage shock protein E
MSLFDLFKYVNINEELTRFRENPDAVLLDVRTREEYAEGHIPGSINIPISDISDVVNVVQDHDKQIFVYCLRGSRSKKAVDQMRILGYRNAISIGGIADYKGPIET